MNPNRPHSAYLLLANLAMGFLFCSASLFAQFSITWDRTLGSAGWEELQAMSLTTDGGYLFGGITTAMTPSSEVSQPTKDTVNWPEATGDFWLVKTDGNGNLLWDRRYGGERQDRMWSIQQTADGGYLLGGESRSGVWADRSVTNRGGSDYWIVKINADGEVEWDAAFGGPGDDFLRSALPLPDGGFLLAGFSNSDAGGDKTDNSRGGSDYWVIRLAADRTILWQRTLGGSGEDQLFDAIIAHDGNFMLAGWSASPPGHEKTAPFYGLNDFWIIKLDNLGEVRWQRSLGGDQEDVCQAIYPTQDGQYLFLGQSSSTPGTGNKSSPHFGQWDAWAVKVNDLGESSTITWQQSYGGASGDIAYGAIQNMLGDYFIIGLSFSEPAAPPPHPNFKESALLGASDFWVLHLSPDGDKLRDETLGGTDTDAGIKIAKAHGSGYILAGHSSSGISFPYKSEPSRGLNDFWVVRTGCGFPSPVLEDLTKTCLEPFVEMDATIAQGCEGCQYLWHDGESGPVRQFSPDSTLMVMVTVFHPDGCSESDSALIVVVPGPHSLVADAEGISCPGKTDAAFFVESVTGGTPPYQYSLNEGDWSVVAQFSDLAAGQYTLGVQDANGCRYDTAFVVELPQEIFVDLGPDIFLTRGDSTQLQALTNLPSPTIIEWGQPQILSCTNCLNPWATPPVSMTVSIRIADEKGCEARALLRLIVELESSIYIPNAFSPNNDGINDFFTVFADRSVNKVKMLMVFDRWGAKVFEARDFPPNVVQLGWDGSHKGKPMQPNVFVYLAEVEYWDGRTEMFKGDVSVVR